LQIRPHATHPKTGLVHYILVRRVPVGRKRRRPPKTKMGADAPEEKPMAEVPDQPEEDLQRINTSGTGWGFGVLAAVILLILLSYGFGNNGRWGTDGGIAHMMPPVASSNDGPATRAWRPNTP
jgi:hypothetical protein